MKKCCGREAFKYNDERRMNVSIRCCGCGRTLTKAYESTDAVTIDGTFASVEKQWDDQVPATTKEAPGPLRDATVTLKGGEEFHVKAYNADSAYSRVIPLVASKYPMDYYKKIPAGCEVTFSDEMGKEGSPAPETPQEAPETPQEAPETPQEAPKAEAGSKARSPSRGKQGTTRSPRKDKEQIKSSKPPALISRWLFCYRSEVEWTAVSVLRDTNNNEELITANSP